MREAGTAGAEPGALDQVRLMANRRLNPERKAALGQFMTPESVGVWVFGANSGHRLWAELVDAKVAGREITAAAPAEAGGNVLDLMEALRASVDAAKRDRIAGAQ